MAPKSKRPLATKTSKRPSVAFKHLAESWIEGITAAVYRQGATSLSAEPICAEDEIQKLRKEKVKDFDAAYASCLRCSMLLGTQSEVLPLLEGIRNAIGSFERESTTNPIQSYLKHEKLGRTGVPWLNAKSHAEWFADAFRRLGPLIDGAIGSKPEKTSSDVDEHAIFTERELEVWNSLESRCISAKEIAKLIGGGFTEGHVRRVVMEIREKRSDSIRNVRGRGYFRPDAPPPDALARD
jgi:hypothetical protein